MKCYRLTGTENKVHALPEFFEKSSRFRCATCGCLLDPYARTNALDYNGKLDVSCTYDGALIVSRRFRDFVLDECNANSFDIVFYPINGNSSHYYFQILNSIVALDKEKSGILCKERCIECGYYSEVIGGEKLFIAHENQIVHGFFRSDVFWRTHYIFRPAVFVGIETAEKLKAQKFKGIDLYRKIF